MTVNREKTQEAAERHVRKGNLDKAIGLYLELANDDPNDLRSKLKLADLYTRVNDVEKAVQTYMEVGEGYVQNRELDKALAVYKVARNTVPDNWEIAAKMGSLYAEMRRNKDALQILGEAYQGFSSADEGLKAQKVLELMTRLDPEDVGLKIQLAERYKKSQQVQRALSAFYDAADLLRSEGRSDELFQVMQRILFLSPDSLDARKEVIKGLLERGEERRALRHFRTAVSQAPDDIELLSLLGATFEKLDSIDNAVEVYEKMIDIYGGQAYKPAVQQLQDHILDIAPDSDAAKLIKIQREGNRPTEFTRDSEVQNVSPPPMDLLSGDDLFGDRDVLDDVEFLDDPFGVLSDAPPVTNDARDLNEFTRFSQSSIPQANSFQSSPSDDFGPDHTIQIDAGQTMGLDSPTYVYSGQNVSLDDAPTQEDSEPASVNRKDVSHLLKRVESFFQFNLYGQADELTRDIIRLAPDNFYARDQRRRICENLGNTEEAADQLMEMARIVVEDPKLSSKYLSRAMTLTDQPQRFEQYAAEIRAQWNKPHSQDPSADDKRPFALPKPNPQDEQNSEQTSEKTRDIPFEHASDVSVTQNIPLENINLRKTFENINIDDLQGIISNNFTAEDDDNFFVPEEDIETSASNLDDTKDSFDLGFLDNNENDKKTTNLEKPSDQFSNIFNDLDLDFSQLGDKSLSSAFYPKDLGQASGTEPDDDSPSEEMPSLEVGEVYLQSGRYDEAIQTLEPLLSSSEDRVKAQLLLADVYTELGDVPKAAEFLLCVINEEVSTPEQRQEAQNKLSKLS